MCKHTELEVISGNDGEEEETVFRVATAMSDGKRSRFTLICIRGYKVIESRRLCHSQGDFTGGGGQETERLEER